jgi:hypothetical protein
MSDTKYKVNGKDLIDIFAPYSSGSPAPITYYKLPNGSDLNTIFAPYVIGNPQAITTGYKSNSLDLNTFFKALLYKATGTYTTTSGSI